MKKTVGVDGNSQLNGKNKIFQKAAIDSMKVIIFNLVGESSTFRESFHRGNPMADGRKVWTSILQKDHEKNMCFVSTRRPSDQTPGSKSHCWEKGAASNAPTADKIFVAKLNDDIVTIVVGGHWIFTSKNHNKIRNGYGKWLIYRWFPSKTSIDEGFSMAMLNNQMVLWTWKNGWYSASSP